jgi:hypothetical protein
VLVCHTKINNNKIQILQINPRDKILLLNTFLTTCIICQQVKKGAIKKDPAHLRFPVQKKDYLLGQKNR